MIALEPGTIHTFEHLVEELKTRTRQKLGTLHFISKNGFYRCLDLCLTAATLPDLVDICKDRLAETPIGEILRAAPTEEWAEIFGKKMVWRKILPSIKHPLSGKPIAAALIAL